ncbi:unnamed protein product [Mytilus edulis]|uniref:Uncharacterized protein n=1 Tax=Mytilus edulis TaxID=6550 RepID=A0A8S3RBQ5_MYTED|nr:unnamed protein product [Mytilus edulis]
MNLSISDRRKMAGNLNIFDDDSISTWSNSQMNRFLEDMPGFGEEERGWKVVPSISGRLLNPKFQKKVKTRKEGGKKKKRKRIEKKMKKCDEHVKTISPMSWGEISSQIDNLNKIKQEMRRVTTPLNCEHSSLCNMLGFPHSAYISHRLAATFSELFSDNGLNHTNIFYFLWEEIRKDCNENDVNQDELPVYEISDSVCGKDIEIDRLSDLNEIDDVEDVDDQPAA